MTEDKMVKWHHQLNEYEFEQIPGDGKGQGRLECCSPWGRKEMDMTEQLNNYNIMTQAHLVYFLPHSLNHPFLQEILVLLHPNTKIWVLGFLIPTRAS